MNLMRHAYTCRCYECLISPSEQRETSGNSRVRVSDVPNIFTHRPGTLGNPYSEDDTSISTPPEFPPRLLMQTDQQACQQLMDLVHFLNTRWWKDLKTGEPIERNVGEMLMLVVSELAEACEDSPQYNLLLMEIVKILSRAMEGHRKNLMDDKLPHRRSIEVEIADAIIRLLDMGGGLKLDIPGALVEKLAYNATRVDHTTAHRLSENGKKY